MSGVKFDLERIVRPNVLAMSPYSSARDEYKSIDRDMVFIDANENPFNSGLNRYPDPQQRDLKTIIAKQKGVSVAHLLLGNGSDEVLDLLFRAFCRPGIDNVITLPPTYGMYSVLAATNDVETRAVALTASFQPAVDEILAAIDANTKMIFICSPNNPTANLMAENAIITLAKNFNGLIVIDEAYIDFAKAKSWITRLDTYPNLVITQTLSKAYGLAGIRLGMCFGSSAIIAILNRIKPPYNVNSLTQQAALARVEDRLSVAQEIETIKTERASLLKKLPQLSFVEKVWESETNFILARVDDAHYRYKQLIDQGIVVRNRSNQLHCENTLRFTVGTAQENKQLLDTLENLN